MAAETPVVAARFLEERCDFCGACFERCPVVQWPPERARAEIRALVERGESAILTRCTGCMSCNTFCPQDARPHTLIMERWNARYRNKGIPKAARLVLPYQEANLYNTVMRRLPGDEKALVAAWRRNWLEPPAAETMVYAGCNALLQPFLLDSALFDGVPIFGATELCCGEPLYRMGCHDAAREVANHLREELGRMQCKRLVMPCLACYHVIKHVYHDVFDVSFDCEIVAIEDWLLERIESGELSVTPLNKTAVVHDSCWPKASGGHFFDGARRLLARIGVTPVEPAHTRAEALCCGMCAPAARFSLLDALRAARTRLKELEAAGADMAVDYCGGCNWLLYLANRLLFARNATPIYHLLELVQMAAGETPKHRTRERAGAVISAMAPKLLKGYLTPGRFHVEEIAGRPVLQDADIRSAK